MFLKNVNNSYIITVLNFRNVALKELILTNP